MSQSRMETYAFVMRMIHQNTKDSESNKIVIQKNTKQRKCSQDKGSEKRDNGKFRNLSLVIKKSKFRTHAQKCFIIN